MVQMVEIKVTLTLIITFCFTFFEFMYCIVTKYFFVVKLSNFELKEALILILIGCLVFDISKPGKLFIYGLCINSLINFKITIQSLK